MGELLFQDTETWGLQLPIAPSGGGKSPEPQGKSVNARQRVQPRTKGSPVGHCRSVGTKGSEITVEVGATAATLALHSDGQADNGRRRSRGLAISSPESSLSAGCAVAREPACRPRFSRCGEDYQKDLSLFN